MTFSLLSTSNTKTMKGEKVGYMTYILHLAPYTLGGINVCPKATAGCIAGCLNTAGRGGMFKAGETTNTVQKARIRRTELFANNRELFMETLITDITKAIKQAERKGMIPVFRLNGTSDLSWEKYYWGGKTVFEHFPTVQFYDYTKVLGRKVSHIHNYHLTFSRAESNHEDVTQAFLQGMNVAYVFNKTPTEWYTIPVHDGDVDDLRFLDPKGVIVGLKAKGRAKKDTTGFVIRTI